MIFPFPINPDLSSDTETVRWKSCAKKVTLPCAVLLSQWSSMLLTSRLDMSRSRMRTLIFILGLVFPQLPRIEAGLEADFNQKHQTQATPRCVCQLWYKYSGQNRTSLRKIFIIITGVFRLLLPFFYIGGPYIIASITIILVIIAIYPFYILYPLIEKFATFVSGIKIVDKKKGIYGFKPTRPFKIYEIFQTLREHYLTLDLLV